MPRKSLRRKTIESMRYRVSQLKKQSVECEILDEEDSLEDDKYTRYRILLSEMIRKRYLFRSSKYRQKRKKFDVDDALSFNSNNINDEEFLSYFRISRQSFFLLVDQMKETKVFSKISKTNPQRSLSFQLLVFLFRIGKEGTEGGSVYVSVFFSIGKGSVNNYVRRCVRALLELKPEVVYWPDKDERQDMRNRLSALGFRHCVGIIDGTLVQLVFRPEAYHECYYSRKCFYCINVMIVCDDNKRITFYNAGWPGSTHDNRVFRNSKLFNKRGKYFSNHEYLLGDSAYSASPVMVQAFKKQASVAELPPQHEFFNTCLAKSRIASEHCIGILKGRFKCMKRINIKLKNSKEEVKEVVDMIGACIVLHNLLINYEEDEIPKSWYDDINDNIDWGLYDEEQDDIPRVTEKNDDRRVYVYNSLINNFLL